MKAKQKTIIKIFILVLIIMLLFPITYKVIFSQTHNFKYVFIISLLNSDKSYFIHTGLYIIQITLISMIFALIYYLNKD